jgi:hypothetical protein
MTVSEPPINGNLFYQIWSSGGGTQSAAIAVLICQGRLPRPDRAVIADTGREKKATWKYMDEVVNPALKRLRGFEIERIPCPVPPALFNPEGTLLLPVFVTGEAKFANFCSSYWKREKVKQWANREGLTPAVNWIGFSTNEMKRVSVPRAGNWLLNYPLIYRVPMSRWDCVRLIADYGWPPAPRSACWMCPNMTNEEWRDIRDNSPEEFAQAVQLEREMQERKPDAFLHRSLMPLDLAPIESADDQQTTFGCDSGDCFV